MAVYAKLRNVESGELKSVKVGFSWTLLVFTQFFGIPLFMRRLWQQGGLMLLLCLHFEYITWNLDFDDPSLLNHRLLGGFQLLLIIIASIAYSVWGNKLTATAMLKNGWVFADSNDLTTKYAKSKWSIE